MWMLHCQWSGISLFVMLMKMLMMFLSSLPLPSFIM